MKSLENIVAECREWAFDLEFRKAKAWKEAGKGRLLAGYMPIYVPREIIHASNALPVGIFGAGDRKQVVKGDAYYQSYICHIPRGIIELALDNNLKGFDAFVFPAICDVIRNLSGIFRVMGVGQYVKYLDFPQNFQSHIGGEFYRHEMEDVIKGLTDMNGVTADADRLNHAIGLYNINRRLIESIYDVRQEFPWRLPFDEFYTILRAGTVIPVEEHNEMLEQVLEHINHDIGEPMDKIKVVVSGAFCEQPPLGLIRSIELAGCYVVDDDLMLGSRMIEGDVRENSNAPLEALSEAYLNNSRYSSSIYDVDKPKEERLAGIVARRKADGVIFAAPSFCDPSLLDAPIFQKAFQEKGLRFISFQYSENTGQFKVIKEQVGAFSDSIKLWEDDTVTA